MIWLAEEIRDEHRQAMEWLNQRTDTETQFFAIVAEVLQIDDSNPALNFKLVVSPNEWQKSQKRKPVTSLSPKYEKYRDYFQALIDELREKYGFTGAKVGQPQSWYDFPSGKTGITYNANFRRDGLYASVSIYQKQRGNRIALFDALKNRKSEIESNFGSPLEWNRAEEQQTSWIAISCDGDIESSYSDLGEMREWHIKNLLKLKEVFQPEIEQALAALNTSEKEEV